MSDHRVAPGRRLVATASATAALTLLGLTGCGSDGGSANDTSTTVAESTGSTGPPRAESVASALLPESDAAQTLPPNDIGGLRRIYDPALATMGLRLTRGALIDLTNDGYVPSNSGTHLALYVEPIDAAFTNAQYVEGLWTVSALITPDVFSRWSELESYDICQEPPPSVDDRDEPLPYTQINLTRAVSDDFDWANGDLVELLAAARTDPDFKLIVAKTIRDEATYEAARAAANTKAANESTTTTSG